MSILEKRTYDSQGRARTAYRYVIAVDHPGTDETRDRLFPRGNCRCN
jgi:hypothetical protein